MDINLFELGGKAVRRSLETLEDTYMFTEEVFSNSFPMSLVLGHSDWVGPESRIILDQARESLRHDELQEAAHQLRRDVYFCSISPKLADSQSERAAQAGLNAITHNQSAAEIQKAIETAWRNRTNKE